MKPGIQLTNIWFDQDVVELRIEVCDGVSFFSNQVHVGRGNLEHAASDLDAFKTHLHGGLLDIRFGEFGPEYANGAFQARFHFPKPGPLFITCQLQSSFEEFSIKNVASEATLYLRTEPGLLDAFIPHFRALASDREKSAYLEGI